MGGIKMPKWRNQIEIKQYLSSDSSNESVLKVVDKLIPKLKIVMNRENRLLKHVHNELKKENIEHVLYELETLIEEFEWIKSAIENNEDATEFEYEDWCEAFNNYFAELYDLGDTVVYYVDHNNNEKFLWVS
jgi:hypothetical protein